MRRALFLTILSISTLTSIGAFGRTHPPVGGFSISGEWLYMYDANNIPFFVVNGTSPGGGSTYLADQLTANAAALPFDPDGSRVANDQNWHSGYRLEGIYRFCDADYLAFRWTQFPEFSNSKDERANPSALAAAGAAEENALGGVFTFPAFSTAGFVESDFEQRFSFYYLELLYERDIYTCCPFYLTVNGGFQYARLRFKESINFNGSNTNVTAQSFLLQNTMFTHSKREGVGPEVGFEMEYDVTPCFSAVMRGWGALLVARKHTETEMVAGTTSGMPFGSTTSVASTSLETIDEHDEGYWLLTPAADLRIGLDFDWCWTFGCDCPTAFNFNIEAGYEVIAYFRALDRIHNVSDVDTGNSFNEYSNFMLHGPYLQLGVSF